MNAKNVLIFFLLNMIFTFGQSKQLIILNSNSTNLNADTFVGIDGLEFIYYIKNNVFYKQKKTETWQYQNIGLGEITKIDIVNPLKIVLFYQNFNTVVVLDNQLNEIQTVNFSLFADGIIASGIGKSTQNNIWVFNTNNQKLGLFNYENDTYTTLNQPLKNNLLWFESDFNYFNWIDDKQLAFTIDVFGKITEFGIIPKFDTFQMIQNQGYFYSKNNLLTYCDFKTNQNYTIEILKKTIKNFKFKDQILTIFTGEQIINYKIQLP